MTKPNSKCPCGSGKKYKKCCKKRDQQLRGTASSGNKHLSVYQRGVRYELGEGGVEQNYSHALELFKLASRTSDNIKEVQDSFVNIGFFHERGFGTEQDYNKAREAYEVAAAKAIELNDPQRRIHREVALKMMYLRQNARQFEFSRFAKLRDPVDYAEAKFMSFMRNKTNLADGRLNSPANPFTFRWWK
jgi:TPR repeat protein